MRMTLFVAIGFAALVGAACSSGSGAADSGGSGGDGSSATAACTADSATDLSADDPFTITIQNIAYEPACVKVSSSASITIVNKDATAHTFTVDGTPVNVALPPSQTVSGKSPGFSPATYVVHCTIHASMAATVIVV
jgi:plastocyanin